MTARITDHAEPLRRLARIAALALAVGAILPIGGASAETLQDALAKAYVTNPRLLAAQAALRATDETVPQALSGWRPTIIANGDVGQEWNDPTGTASGLGGGGGGGNDSFTPRGANLQVTQPLYRGGRTVSETSQAENLVLAQRSILTDTEQSVLLDAVIGYMDVLRDGATYELTVNTEDVLRRDLEATQARYDVGELTKTDVAQAESRLADATAQRIAADGALQVSRARYAEVIGDQPGTLEPTPPPVEIPGSEEEVVAGAENAPLVSAAIYNEQAAIDGIDVAFSDLLPSLNLVGTAATADDISSSGAGQDSASIVLQLRIPLYQAGAPDSVVRQSKQVASQRRQELLDQRRIALSNAVSAWQILETARASIDSFEAAVAANRIALEGVRLESEVGARTVLDVLDAEREYLDAQVSLVRAKRDQVVAAYAVLATNGRLTARDLGLPVDYYDVEAYYNAVRNKFWGTDIPNPEPTEATTPTN